MYTQCPECGVAFRVTAEVLKQAAGKVRCGGCGVAFNALNHLSEQKPVAPVQSEQLPDPQVPELEPEAPSELEADTPPQSISAEQSAALLKTLDQLAGSDIRIEDTGVEWRVLDEDEADTDDDTPDEPELIADTGSLKFIVEGDEDVAADEPLEVIEEMRFDDNTPLPEDFEFASEPVSLAEPQVEAPEPEPEPDDAQVDLALGDPDEWEDLLGDLVEPAAADAREDPEPETETDDERIEAQESLIMLAEAQPEDAVDQPLDMDTQFAIQAEAMGIDLSGVHETAAEDDVENEDDLEEQEPSDDDVETSIEEDLIAAAFETEAAAQPPESAASAAGPLAEEETEEVDLEEEEEEEEEEIELEIDANLEPEDELEIEDDIEDIALAFDDKVEEAIETIAASLDEEPVEDEPRSERQIADDASDEPVIPEMSEEEKTINMMIDRELFNIAVEDEDGFASTIVQRQPSKKVDKELADNQKENKDDSPPLVETIIMEGEFIRGDLDREKLAADKTATSRGLDDPGVSFPLKQTMYGALRGGLRDSNPPGIGMIAAAIALVLLLVLQVLHQSREALATVPAFSSAVGPVYRALGQPLTPTWNISGWRFEATKGSTDTVGESADLDTPVETSEVLTIYSRVGNKSDKALPYPLVHVSLTDRFEEIIGSRVLEPAEYLPENADPRKPVPPGNTFNAVISIESPSEEATGFKLYVCYRLASGQLRCAIEDFK